jgi:hypothetical protein
VGIDDVDAISERSLTMQFTLNLPCDKLPDDPTVVKWGEMEYRGTTKGEDAWWWSLDLREWFRVELGQTSPLLVLPVLGRRPEKVKVQGWQCNDGMAKFLTPVRIGSGWGWQWLWRECKLAPLPEGETCLEVTV